jgi:hypothetical protein
MAGANQLDQSFKQQVFETLTAPVFAGTNAMLIEIVKLQAQVLLPVFKALRVEIGEERANRIARTTLREMPQKLFQDIGPKIPGSSRQKWEAIYSALIERFSGDVEAEMPGQERDALSSNVNGRRVADFFRELREQELRSVLACDVGLSIAAVDDCEVRINSDAKENEWCEVW